MPLGDFFSLFFHKRCSFESLDLFLVWFRFVEASITTPHHICPPPVSSPVEPLTPKPLGLCFWAWTAMSPRRYFRLSQLEEGVALASSGWRPKLLPNLLQCTGQPPSSKSSLAHDVNSSAIEKLRSSPSRCKCRRPEVSPQLQSSPTLRLPEPSLYFTS